MTAYKRASTLGSPIERLEEDAGILVGCFAGFSQDGDLSVDWDNNPAGELVKARSTVQLSEKDIGAEVVLMFEKGDPLRPIIVGVVQGKQSSESTLLERILEGDKKNTNVEIDGEAIRISATKDVVISCGEASITLTKAGKLILKGTYVLSRSAGLNRIQGGTVQVN